MPDCCDGSDEVQGCKNTCKAAGSAARLDLVSKTQEYAAGAKVRHKYVSQAKSNKDQWNLDLIRIQKDISSQQAVTDQAKGEHPTNSCMRVVQSYGLLRCFAQRI